MGGAGKTTLLTQLNNTFSRAAILHEFDHVIYVEIGQQQNLGTVQQSIASQLGLTLGQDESITARFASLYNFLKEKKFLLLMDNLWQPLDLVKVGIAQGYGKIGPQNMQMIVITTRDQQICHRMQALNHLIVLQRLNFEQAWSLFGANAGCHGLTNSSAQIRVLAESIVEKCGGLPLALKIVGQAMASKQIEHEWKHAAILLEQSQYHKVLDADAEIDLYHVLYMSYIQLLDERTKQCFLLFALLATRHCIYIPYTIDLWMGHRLLDEDDDISINYLRGHSVIGCLKRACLLEEHPRGKNYLRMHDTIQGLVLWIVKSKQGDGPNKNWLVRTRKETVKPEECSTTHKISFCDLRDVVDLSGPCRRLITLVCRSRGLSHVPTEFFRIATSLTYMDLSQSPIRELPSGVGESVNLQYLGLSDTPIQSIPMELQLLKSLRYLDLSYTTQLETIPDGTISALIMLRSLNLYNSWCFPPDKTQAHIEELKSLTCLESLGFTVSDSDSLQIILDPSKPSVKYISIENAEGLRVLNITPAFVSKNRAHQLERLTLGHMKSLKEFSIGESIVDSYLNFEVLDELRLEKIMKLENIIWKGVVPHACLPRLRLLMIHGCHGIRAITWIKQLPCLEEVYLNDCDSIIELVSDNSEARRKAYIEGSLKSLCIANIEGLQVLRITSAFFSKKRAHQLERLTLRDMKSLKELSIGETSVDSDWHFEVLFKLRLERNMKLENIIWKGVVPHACLPRLRLLMIRGCHCIRAITWIKQLPCLEEVYLIDCNSMLELVADDAEGITMSSDGDSFPRLKLLGLSRLPNLQNICDSTLAFPCLQRLLVYSCPKLAKLPSGLLQPEHAPLILSQQNLWEQLCWEDSSVKSTLFSFFRDLPATFQGYPPDVYRALTA